MQELSINRQSVSALIAIIVGFFVATLFAPKSIEGAPLIELKVGENLYVGKSIAHDKENCWLAQQDGRYRELSLREVEKFRKVSSNFKPHSASQVRAELYKELGSGFEIVKAGPYLVCAPRGRAKKFGPIFSDLYDSFTSYFSVRGFRFPKPEYPLVAIIFPDHASFAAYARNEKVNPVRGLMGYYMPESNRVALFEENRNTSSFNPKLPNETFVLGHTPNQKIHGWNSMNTNSFASIGGDPVSKNLEETIIHEATHQIAFNTGLHHRIGDTPRWVIEGLAMVFESPGIRTYSRSDTPLKRINMQRFSYFGSYSQNRRPKKALKAFIENDDLFFQSPLDAYAEAWAFSFFLIETRPGKYVKYLKKMTSRSSTSDYPDTERLADFKATIGSNLSIIEADYLNFIKKLK